MEAQSPTIAIFPTPGMGHIVPLAELSKRLVHNLNFSVTLFIPNDGAPPSKAQDSLLKRLPPAITHTYLPPVNFDDLPKDTNNEAIVALTALRSLPSLRAALKDLKLAGKTVVALVVDLFGTDAFDVAREVNIPPFLFFSSSAICLSLIFHLPTLDETVSCEYRDVPDLIEIPGCVPIRGIDLLDPIQNRKSEAYKWVLHHAKRYVLAEGILMNGYMELESRTMKYLVEQTDNAPVYPIGPVVGLDAANEPVDDLSGSLKWLDEQPDRSVLYVSFGSAGTLTKDQINELALGLESSGQRFLWVVRSPNEKVANAAYFNEQSEKNPFDFLPDGFLERTKERGLVVSSWAPQDQVLCHGSTGGFLTHCGWNSVLEGIFNGLPLIAWPLYAEQKMNAIVLNEDVKIALRPKVGDDGNGLVVKEEIAKVVRELFEGEEGRRIAVKVKELKEAGVRALSEDGHSSKTLSKLAQKLRNKIAN